ncbi:MAG: triose-phosphate isomerase [Candidatus Dormiibacterota bacterium]
MTLRRPTPLVAGNWKMNTTVGEGVELAGKLRSELDGAGVEVELLPPFTHLVSVGEALRGSRLLLGAQDCYAEDSGAFTGEVSPAMLAGLCHDVLLGHSERRHILGESDELIARKLIAARRHHLRIILAVGETESERLEGATMSVVDRHLRSALEGLEDPAEGELVIAYEPVWAIGTGRTATPDQAEEVCVHIATRLDELLGEVATTVPILYGGSVTADNAAELFAERHLDGALVGGASLRVNAFTAIVRACEAGRASDAAAR